MERTLNGTPHVQAAEAALELHTTHLRVLMLLKQEKLDGCRVEGDWYVERRSLDCLKQHGVDPLESVTCRTACSAAACSCKG